MTIAVGPSVPEFWVGTYTGKSTRGLIPLGFTSDCRRWHLGPPEAAIENASFAVYNPRFDLYYIVDEQEGGRVGTWSRSQTGVWNHIETVSTQGAAPCFVTLNVDLDRLAVANYESGSVAQFPLDSETGRLLGEPAVFQNSGKGPVVGRQNGPHAHCVRFAYGFLFSTDLGTDEVLAWPQSIAPWTPSKPLTAFNAPPDEGPRHLVFHPTVRIAYLLTEIGSKVFVLDVTPTGVLRLRATLSTLPGGYGGASLGGHLVLNAAGTRLYASNRGHDSLAVFEVGKDGELRQAGIYPTFGRSPRHFSLAEDIAAIVIAHQNSNTVDIIALDADGRPGSHLDWLPVHQPAFIGRVSLAATPR